MNASHRISACRSGRPHSGQESCQFLARKDLQSQVGSGEKSSVPQGKAFTVNAKEDQCGMEQHSGVWSSAVSAVVWSLPHLHVGSCVLHPPGSLDKCLSTLMPSEEFPQEPIYGWSHSADMDIMITCADILGVSPCHMCLCDLGSFPLEPTCHG